jgi:hypothetical protein
MLVTQRLGIDPARRSTMRSRYFYLFLPRFYFLLKQNLVYNESATMPPYEYSLLPTSDSIRLLTFTSSPEDQTISCKLETFQLYGLEKDTCLPFTAVSSVWGHDPASIDKVLVEETSTSYRAIFAEFWRA